MKEEINIKLDEKGVKYCLNEQQYDYSKLRYIIVGDNPGLKEYKENRFFVGSSGQLLRKHFKENNLIGNFDKECIIFNKTIIHTEKTNELKGVIEKIGKELFQEIQRHCALEIAQISNELKIPILIFGKSQLGTNLLFEIFWKSLNESIENKKHILVYNHPSHNNFSKEWTKYRNEFQSDSSNELLNRIGLKNAAIIKKKFKC